MFEKNPFQEAHIPTTGGAGGKCSLDLLRIEIEEANEREKRRKKERTSVVFCFRL